MTNRKLAASKGRQEVYFDFSDEIVILALKALVGLLFYNDNDVPSFGSRRLVALASKLDRLSALHALVDVHLEEFFLWHHLLALALPTPVLRVDYLPGT